MGEKHAHARDEKAKKKVSRTNMGNGGKAHTCYKREGKKKSAGQTWAMGEKHTHATDEKARKSEQEKHGQWGKAHTG
jgi:hypothetical protein